MFNDENFIICLLMIIDDDDVIEHFLSKINRKVIYNSSWYYLSLPQYDDVQFRATFRMNRRCMNFIIENFFSEAKIIDTRKNRMFFHILIYYTAHCITYRDIGDKFGVPASTIYRNINNILFKNKITLCTV